jgi:uncharacterized protein (UPF0216 family)
MTNYSDKEKRQIRKLIIQMAGELTAQRISLREAKIHLKADAATICNWKGGKHFPNRYHVEQIRKFLRETI